MTSKSDIGPSKVVSPFEVARRIDGRQEDLPLSEAEKAVETARRDRVMASAERVMRKHRATFAALAK